MNRLTITIIFLNVLGLAVVQALESWRWGTISSIMSLSWIWLVSAILTGGAIILSRRAQKQ